MLLPLAGYAASSGRLREVYDRKRERPMPPAYRPSSCVSRSGIERSPPLRATAGPR